MRATILTIVAVLLFTTVPVVASPIDDIWNIAKGGTTQANGVMVEYHPMHYIQGVEIPASTTVAVRGSQYRIEIRLDKEVGVVTIYTKRNGRLYGWESPYIYTMKEFFVGGKEVDILLTHALDVVNGRPGLGDDDLDQTIKALGDWCRLAEERHHERYHK
jgi:hypothetical protein